MNRTFAKVLSIVLHPVLMPGYALYFLLHFSTYFAYTTQPKEKLALYSIVFLNTLILPLAISYFLLKRGWIHSFEMEKKEERIIPFISNAILMLIAYYMMRKLMLPKIFDLLILGAAASVVLAVIINLKWKISIHMIAVGGVIGSLFALSIRLGADFILPIYLVILLAGFMSHKKIMVGNTTVNEMNRK